MRGPGRAVLALVLLLATVPVAHAAEGTPARTGIREGDVTVLADRLEEQSAQHTVIATGHVEVTRGTMRLLADRVELHRDTGETVAEGRVVFYDGEDQLTAARVEYNFKTGTGVVSEGEIHTAPYYRVAGSRLERLDDRLYRVEHGMFTTCSDDPPTWSFRFGEATATLDESVWGRDASLWVRDVPVIPWVPVFGAPLLRHRQTGLLVPEVGESTAKGLFTSIPYFWAISDSQDATVTLEAYEKRGLGVEGEYRYVLSESQKGLFQGFYLRELFGGDGNPVHDDNRAWWHVVHDWRVAPGFAAKADIKGVSDDRVFREYADSLGDRRLQRAESNVFVTRRWANWNLVGNLFWYQDLTTERPVELQRLPEIKLQGTRQPLPGAPGFLYEVEASAVNFVRDVGSDGFRGDLHPRVSRPIPLAGYLTVTPFAGGRLTAYDKTAPSTRQTLNGNFTVDVTEDEPRVRRLVETGADVETRVSRVYDLGGRYGLDAVLHSIEPRLNYTWVEGSDFKHVPNYESTVDDIRPSSLFTYSLINRLRARHTAGEDTTRWELARFTLAQTYNLAKDARPLGDLTSELIVDPGRLWSFRGDAALNVYGHGFRHGTTDFYLHLDRVTASVGTRFDHPDVNFLQGGLRAELTRALVARVSTNWDLRKDVFVENRFGADVRFDCWSFTLEYVSRAHGEDEVRFKLNLLGVGTTGALQ